MCFFVKQSPDKHSVYRGLFVVRVVGVEPTHHIVQDPKSCASANSAIPARYILW